MSFGRLCLSHSNILLYPEPMKGHHNIGPDFGGRLFGASSACAQRDRWCDLATGIGWGSRLPLRSKVAKGYPISALVERRRSLRSEGEEEPGSVS